jgi:hypothetical protein
MEYITVENYFVDDPRGADVFFEKESITQQWKPKYRSGYLLVISIQ